MCDDGTMLPDDPLLRFCHLIEEALVDKGMSMKICRDLRPMLTEAGFENIHVIRKRIPIGEWQDEEKMRYIGRMERFVLLDVVAAVLCMFEERGMSKPEREVWAAGARRGIDNLSVHRYFMQYFWVAQKPGGEAEE